MKLFIPFFSLLFCAGLLSARDRKLHHSTTVIEIHQTQFPVDTGIAPSPNFLRNQAAILTTGSIIDHAASRTKLDADETKKSLTVEIIEGTDLIRLTSKSNQPGEPKEILTALTKAYVSVRNEREQKRIAQLIEALEEEVSRREDKVQDRRKALTVLTEHYGIPYFDDQILNPIGLAEEEMYRRAQGKLDQLEQDRNHLQIQIRKLSKASKEDLVLTAARLGIPENQVAAYYTQYRSAEEQVSELIAGGLGEKHPEVITTKRSAKQALENAEKEVIALKEILETRLNLVDKQVEKMELIVRGAKSGTVNLSKHQHQYHSTREAYEQAKQDLRELTTKLKETRLLLKLPRHPITVHEEPR